MAHIFLTIKCTFHGSLSSQLTWAFFNWLEAVMGIIFRADDKRWRETGWTLLRRELGLSYVYQREFRNKILADKNWKTSRLICCAIFKSFISLQLYSYASVGLFRACPDDPSVADWPGPLSMASGRTSVHFTARRIHADLRSLPAAEPESRRRNHRCGVSWRRKLLRKRLHSHFRALRAMPRLPNRCSQSHWRHRHHPSDIAENFHIWWVHNISVLISWVVIGKREEKFVFRAQRGNLQCATLPNFKLDYCDVLWAFKGNRWKLLQKFWIKKHFWSEWKH